MVHHVIPVLREPDFRFESANICVYCGQAGPELKLTREHIVPDGLGGNLILPDASCVLCADKMKAFETEVINNNFGGIRDAWGIRSRKKRSKNYRRNEKYQIYEIEDEYYDRPIEFSINKNMPFSIWLEHSGVRPAVFTGEEFSTGNAKAVKIVVNYNKLTRPTRLRSRPARTGNFTKFAAKVAHSYACAVLGVGKFNPWLLGYLETVNLTNPYLIGDSERKGVGSRLHQIGLEILDAEVSRMPNFPRSRLKLVVVYLELFAPLGSPVLEIVVGEVPTPLP